MTSTKSERLQLRLTNQQKDIIARAAQVKQTTMSNFILEKSYEVAVKVLSEQTIFSLADEEWDNFAKP